MNIYINVAQLLKEPIGSSRSYKIDEPSGNEEINSVKGRVLLTLTNRSILVKGVMTANVEGNCTRCLNPVDCSVSIDLEEEFFPSIDISSGAPLPKEPENFTIDNNNVLDLGEAVRQYTLLSIPTKLLCRPDCAGICPSCGHNLNKGACKRSPQAPDQRWSKLVHLGKERGT